MATDPDAVIVLDHPLLIETGQADDLDGLIVVLHPRTPGCDACRSIAALTVSTSAYAWPPQADDDARRAAATWIIDNDGTLEELRATVDRVVDDIGAGLVTSRALCLRPEFRSTCATSTGR